MKTHFVFDEERCVGCGACTVACMDQNDISAGEKPLRAITRCDRGPEGPLWQFIHTGCLHCDPAPCIPVCPKGCIARDGDTGLVISDNANCIGCGSCANACPHGAIHFVHSKITKCGGCLERVRVGLLPPCVKVCPHGALRFPR